MKDILKTLVTICLSNDKGAITDCLSNSSLDGLPHLLQKNGLAPMAWHNLKQTGLMPGLVTDFARQLERFNRQSALHNLRIRVVFETIGRIFIRNNIQFVALKGVYLQHLLYNSPVLRPMLDIDIFVPGQNLSLARQELLLIGGKEIFNDPSEFINSLRHQSFPIIVNGISVEMHRNLVDSFDNEVSLGPHLVLAETAPFTIGSVETLALKDELLLLHLCHHVFSTLQGGTVKLISYFDIHFLILLRGAALNWNKVRELCLKTGAFHSVSTSLCVVTHLFGTPGIPVDLLQGSNILEGYLNLLFRAVTTSSANTDNKYYLSKFSRINGWKNRFEYLKCRAMPDMRYIEHKYIPNNFAGYFVGYIKELRVFLFSSVRSVYFYLRNYYIKR